MSNPEDIIKKPVKAMLAPFDFGIVSSKAVDALLPKTPKADAPAVTPPPIMPTPDDAAMVAARKRSLAEQISRRGRASTILTNDNAEKLG